MHEKHRSAKCRLYYPTKVGTLNTRLPDRAEADRTSKITSEFGAPMIYHLNVGHFNPWLRSPLISFRNNYGRLLWEAGCSNTRSTRLPKPHSKTKGSSQQSNFRTRAGFNNISTA